MGIIDSPMARHRIRHRVEETRNTCSRAVLNEDTIVIRLARNLSQEERREHIRSLLRRMMEQVLKEQRKKRITPFRHILDGGETLTIQTKTGKTYRFFLTPDHRTRVSKLTGRQNGWVVHIGPKLRRPTLHRLLWNLLAQAETQRMKDIARVLNRKTLRVPIHEVKLSFAKSQWGSCSPKGVIMINA